MDRKQIKKNAKEMVKGNKLSYFLIALAGGFLSAIVTFVIGVVGSLLAKITGVSALTAVFSVVSAVVSLVMTACLNMSILNAGLSIYDMGSCSASDVTYGYKDMKRAWGIYWRQLLFTSLWSLLFIIPGFIKGMSYSMAAYIAIDNYDMSAKECFNKSKEIMKGQLGKYFMMMLSFFGWSLLVAPTLGIITFWLAPYMQASYAGFYRELVGDSSTTSQNDTVTITDDSVVF